jgi:SAM-dependent methyltransferase
MRFGHFETLRPLCPVCREQRCVDRPLQSASAAATRGDRLIQGSLICPGDDCRAEYPVIDGVPLLLANLRSFVTDNAILLTARDDLTETVEGMIGDALGPGSAMDVQRLHLSSYAWDHYAEFDPAETVSDIRPGAVLRCLEAGLGLLGRMPEGPVLDLGCAVGRASFELAQRTAGLVLGLDVHVPMLRLAQRVLEDGEVSYPRRRVGLVYDRRTFQARLPSGDRVDFWLADALQAPFADGSFGLVTALNLLDCVPSPHGLLMTIARLLKAGGGTVLATPFDWSARTTPVEAWIGGHSQRGEGGGAAEPLLTALLTPGAHPMSVPGLTLRGEVESVPWAVRLHDRGAVHYRSYVLAAEREDRR